MHTYDSSIDFVAVFLLSFLLQSIVDEFYVRADMHKYTAQNICSIEH